MSFRLHGLHGKKFKIETVEIFIPVDVTRDEISALSNGMKYPMQSQINSHNRLNGFVLRFNCLIFNILYICNHTYTSHFKFLSIRSDPGFVNPFRSGFCQSVPIRVLSIRSDPFRSVPIRSDPFRSGFC